MMGIVLQQTPSVVGGGLDAVFFFSLCMSTIWVAALASMLSIFLWDSCLSFYFQ